jgi:uncharacterized DUF497 family protein
MPDWSRYQFDWNETNAEHIVDEHSLYPEEVEQVFANRPHVIRRGELYQALGRSDDGYLLTVIFAFEAGIVRVVTARPMDRSERRLYDRHR